MLKYPTQWGQKCTNNTLPQLFTNHSFNKKYENKPQKSVKIDLS